MLMDTRTLVNWWEKRIGDKSAALELYNVKKSIFSSYEIRESVERLNYLKRKTRIIATTCITMSSPLKSSNSGEWKLVYMPISAG